MSEAKSAPDPYDIGDTSHDAALDEVQEPAPRPRGPDGKFVSAPEDGPAAHKHSKQTLRLAKDLDLPQSEIDGNSPEVLDKLVYHLSRKQAELDREHSRQTLAQRSASTAPDPKPSAPVEEDLGFDTSEYDENLIRFMRQMKKENQELKEQIGKLTGHLVEKEETTNAARIDRFFASRNNDARYGAGAAQQMDVASQAFRRRMAVLNEARQLAGDKATPDQIIAKLPEAERNIYGDSEPQPSRQPVQRTEQAPAQRNGTGPVQHGRAVSSFGNGFTPDEWNEGGLRRPTQRGHGPQEPGEAKALATAERILAERNGGGDGETDINSFL